MFNKKLYLNKEKCPSTVEWLTEQKWKDVWLNKVKELASRYSFNTQIFAIELWNEMNCVSGDVNAWNAYMLLEVKKLFPNTMVVNSVGSLDAEYVLDMYQSFPWDKCDFKQMHRYLD